MMLQRNFDRCQLLTAFAFVFIGSSVYCNEKNTFYVKDNTKEGTSIGRIAHSNSIPNDDSRTQLELVRSREVPAVYFAINSNRSELFAQRVLDREQLCPPPNQNTGSFSPSTHRLSSLKDTIECRFQFQVAVYRVTSDQPTSDRGIPDFVDVTVVLVDVNDHAPVFQVPNNRLDLRVSEAVSVGTRLRLPLAHDPDSIKYSIQQYKLVPNNFTEWTLFEQTKDRFLDGQLQIIGLFLVVQSNLDRERRSAYTFDVHAFDSDFMPTAFDRSTGRNVLRVSLTVSDDNDNGPVFVPPTSQSSLLGPELGKFDNHGIYAPDIVTYPVSVVENIRPNSRLLTLKAEDQDSSEFAVVNYGFAPMTDATIMETFSLNQHTGDLFLTRSLNYERETSYSFYVIAYDKVHHQLETGSKLVRSSASTATGQQHNVFTATAQVIVSVKDVNDEVPTISVDYLSKYSTLCRPGPCASLHEGLDPPQFVANLLVTDNDADATNSRVTCDLVSDDLDTRLLNVFRLSELTRKTGQVAYNLLTNRQIDREELNSGGNSQISVGVRCSDSGSPTLRSETKINVRIIDVNDNAPELTLELIESSMAHKCHIGSLCLLENTVSGTVLGRIHAVDKDEGNNGRVICSLDNESHSIDQAALDYFSINPHSCELTLTKTIDRESTNLASHNITLSIVAQDLGSPPKSSTTQLNIILIDVNDNPPSLDRQFYQFNVPENQPNGTCIGTLVASDPDGDQFLLTLRFQRHEPLPFVIWTSPESINDTASRGSRRTFYLNTTEALDRERRGSYEFSVLLTDNAAGSRVNKDRQFTATSTVYVSVDDLNDNDPMIIFPRAENKMFNLSTAARQHQRLMKVNAKDDDIDSQLTFKLQYDGLTKLDKKQQSGVAHQLDQSVDTKLHISEVSRSFLRIDSDLGDVYLNRDMSRNDTGLHVYHISVSDTLQAPRATSLRFIVNVLDIPIQLEKFNTNELSPHRPIPINYPGDKQTGQHRLPTDLRQYDALSTNAVKPRGRFHLQQITGDAILILSLGLILLLLLLTLCLVVYAKTSSSRTNRRLPSRTQIRKPFLVAIGLRRPRMPTNKNNNIETNNSENVQSPNSTFSEPLKGRINHRDSSPSALNADIERGRNLVDDSGIESLTLSRRDENAYIDCRLTPLRGSPGTLRMVSNETDRTGVIGDYTALYKVGDVESFNGRQPHSPVLLHHSCANNSNMAMPMTSRDSFGHQLQQYAPVARVRQELSDGGKLFVKPGGDYSTANASCSPTFVCYTPLTDRCNGLVNDPVLIPDANRSMR